MTVMNSGPVRLILGQVHVRCTQLKDGLAQFIVIYERNLFVLSSYFRFLLTLHIWSYPRRGGSYQKVEKLSPLIGVMIKFKVYETHFLLHFSQ
jgi:hypothetical protein